MSVRRVFEGREGVAVGVGFALVLALFWPTLRSFPGTWSGYGMGHGWLIAGLVGWLVWRHRREFVHGGPADPLLLIPLAGLSLLWFAARVAHIQLGHQLAFVAITMLWAIAAFGWKNLRAVLGIGATAILAVPIWATLTPILRRMTTLASGGLVNLTGIENEIRGDVIHIAVGSFLIEDGCAGLSYFVAGLAVGAVYAHVFVRSWPRQLAVAAAGGAIAIVGNWIRVAALVVVGHTTEMQSPLIESHLGFGWAVFAAGLVPFFLLARKVEDGDSTIPRASEERKRDAREGGTSRATESVHAGGLRRLRAIAVASSLAIAGPSLYLGIGAVPESSPRPFDLAGLAQGPEWELLGAPPGPPRGWHPHFPGAERHAAVAFATPADTVHAHHFFYPEQSQTAKLVGFPNRIDEDAEILDERVVGPVDAAGRRWVRQAILRTAEGAVVVWYWYRVGGTETFSAARAKVLEIPAFVRRRPSAEVVALGTACGPEDCRDAIRSLASLLEARRSRTGEPDSIP